jgi:hypothetical protein
VNHLHTVERRTEGRRIEEGCIEATSLNRETNATAELQTPSEHTFRLGFARRQCIVRAARLGGRGVLSTKRGRFLSRCVGRHQQLSVLTISEVSGPFPLAPPRNTVRGSQKVAFTVMDGESGGPLYASIIATRVPCASQASSALSDSTFSTEVMFST